MDAGLNVLSVWRKSLESFLPYFKAQKNKAGLQTAQGAHSYFLPGGPLWVNPALNKICNFKKKKKRKLHSLSLVGEVVSAYCY